MPDASEPRYWIGVVSREHVLRGVAGGFAMFSHGKHEAMKRTRPGDWVVYYSPKTEMDGGEPLRAFTAIGQVKPGEPYQAEMGEGFTGWRRDVDYCPAQEAPAGPLIGAFSFLKTPRGWGMMLRRGLFPIPREDFAKIAAAMGIDPTSV